MLELFHNGKRKKFFDLWSDQLPKTVKDTDSVAQKLEFYLNIYFAIYPIKFGKGQVSQTSLTPTGHNKSTHLLCQQTFYLLDYVTTLSTTALETDCTKDFAFIWETKPNVCDVNSFGWYKCL